MPERFFASSALEAALPALGVSGNAIVEPALWGGSSAPLQVLVWHVVRKLDSDPFLLRKLLPGRAISQLRRSLLGFIC